MIWVMAEQLCSIHVKAVIVPGWCYGLC